MLSHRHTRTCISTTCTNEFYIQINIPFGAPLILKPLREFPSAKLFALILSIGRGTNTFTRNQYAAIHLHILREIYEYQQEWKAWLQGNVLSLLTFLTQDMLTLLGEYNCGTTIRNCMISQSDLCHRPAQVDHIWDQLKLTSYYYLNSKLIKIHG